MSTLAHQLIPSLSNIVSDNRIKKRNNSANGISKLITTVSKLIIGFCLYVYHKKISIWVKIITVIMTFSSLSAGIIYWNKAGGWEHYGADISESVRTVIGADNMDVAEKYIFKYKDKYNRLVYLLSSEEEILVRQTDDFSGKQFKTKGITKPINFKSILIPEKPNEGQWIQKPGGYWYTFLRPDVKRPYAEVYFYWFGRKDFHLNIMCGTGEPARGPGRISFEKMPDLAAAFSGGFRYQHGGYGLVQEGKVYANPILTPRSKIFGNDIGTIYMSDDSVWVAPHVPDPAPRWHSMRQNLTLLVRDGKPELANLKWGWTVSGSVYTRRSAVGVDQSGNIIYALGDNLSGQTLAIALATGGVWNAIHLDMNPGNVHFGAFAWDKEEKKPVVIDKFNYYPGCYLNTSGRDFFYVTRKKSK